MSAIIGAHPEVATLPFESNKFYNIGKTDHLIHKNYQYIIFILLIIKYNLVKNSNKRWCEKNPKNVRYLQEINDFFDGKIKFILMIRNGRDILTSTHPQKDGYYTSLSRFKKDITLTFKYSSYDNVIVIPYDVLVIEFEKTVKKLFGFLNLPFNSKVMEFHKHTSVSRHGAFRDKTVESIYKSSLNRWKDFKHEQRVASIHEDEECMEIIKMIDRHIEEFNQNLS